jgi:hypothetical protein
VRSHMAVDPETLSYEPVEPGLIDRLAASYGRGLEERLGERRVEPTEALPRLVFVGRVSDPEPWTVLETSQGTHSYLGDSGREGDELAEWVYQFGRTEPEDHWC